MCPLVALSGIIGGLAALIVLGLGLYIFLYPRAAEQAEEDALCDPYLAAQAKAARRGQSPSSHPGKGPSE
ncbi:hypothetical protein [Polymorphum gilvum]|uniref:hypothetical protein n=1 Tax=Polymorphum gilvum TaxID=991904 RepID=UPI0002EAADDC|nr:hypothetical protein [Polymorphum gilvum]